MIRLIRNTLFLMVVLCLLFPLKSFAHSTLVNATPALSSTLSASPPRVVLTFNERLEKEQFNIIVLDSSGTSVTKNITKMSLDQTQLLLDLPPLSKGNYTVSYKIISADSPN